MAFGALIPAAGLSSRMGRFKPLLPLGGGSRLTEEGRTLLHRCSAMQRELRACCRQIFEKHFSDYTLPAQD